MDLEVVKFPGMFEVGIQLIMSFQADNSYVLWHSFMPRITEIENRLGFYLVSAQVYPLGFFNSYMPHTEFVKWASVAVSRLGSVPLGMHEMHIEPSLYLRFMHMGTSKMAHEAFDYIYSSWLPKSDFEVDQRPHFEILGSKYAHDKPHSEEEIYIPIRPKQ